MIISFADAATQRLHEGWDVPKFSAFSKVARRKLLMLEAAAQLDDLRLPPGNRLELLKGKRGHQYSIRINNQWRLCFSWTASGPASVEIIDYH